MDMLFPNFPFKFLVSLFIASPGNVTSGSCDLSEIAGSHLCLPRSMSLSLPGPQLSGLPGLWEQSQPTRGAKVWISKSDTPVLIAYLGYLPFILGNFLFFWLLWVLVTVWAFTLAENRGYSSLRWVGLLLQRPLLLQSTGSRAQAR